MRVDDSDPRGIPAGSALISGRIFLEHKPPSDHPESPARIKAILEKLGGIVKLVEPRQADAQELLLVHDEEYVSLIQSYSETGLGGMIDPDTFVSSGTWISALHAAGASMQAAMLVASRAYNTAFAAIRPPGHHAHPGRGAGFCIFNNAAIAAAKLLAGGVASRVAIVDIDAHYGDGTAHIFYEDPRVLYISLHGDPHLYYPWRGHLEELGRKEGLGYNIPIPLPPGVGDDGYVRVIEELVAPILEDYKPDVTIVSAGFDTHHRDPLMDFELTVQGHWMTAHLLYKAAHRASGKGLAGILEGGYDLRSLPLSVANFLAAYEETPLYTEPKPRGIRAKSGRLEEYLRRARRMLSKYWSL